MLPAAPQKINVIFNLFIIISNAGREEKKLEAIILIFNIAMSHRNSRNIWNKNKRKLNITLIFLGCSREHERNAGDKLKVVLAEFSTLS
jgi:hypothetical protein